MCPSVRLRERYCGCEPFSCRFPHSLLSRFLIHLIGIMISMRLPGSRARLTGVGGETVSSRGPLRSADVAQAGVNRVGSVGADPGMNSTVDHGDGLGVDVRVTNESALRSISVGGDDNGAMPFSFSSKSLFRCLRGSRDVLRTLAEQRMRGYPPIRGVAMEPVRMPVGPGC